MVEILHRPSNLLFCQFL